MQAQHIEFLQLLNGQVQYVVPYWQRRYCWGETEIKCLIDDILTVASVEEELTTHYGGNLLTFPEPGAAGIVKVFRVVDGQQRLTTVSILLACIADKLGPNGTCGEWNSKIIQNNRITNPFTNEEKHRKLKLQNGDEEEYKRGLEGDYSGPGAVSQAWKIVKRLVERNDTAKLLSGLERLRVISIGLSDRDDPQQIFESLNATGKALTESEKVKNWLLMGLPISEQKKLHEEYWLNIEKQLAAQITSQPIDMFLRDFLRWQTGKITAINQVYENFRRWAIKGKKNIDRAKLCKELSRHANLYGLLTGTAGKHFDRKVERQLQHLRQLGIDTHRPLTLRFLSDSTTVNGSRITVEVLAETVQIIGTWITRLWLADRPMSGLNKAFTELANKPGPSNNEDYREYWLNLIRSLRVSNVGVPKDEEVEQGIKSRKAYGGAVNYSSFAVLYAIEKEKQQSQTPSPDHLTIEHVIPQKLTDEWKTVLGENAEYIHEKYCHRLANLTLAGNTFNSAMGNATFEVKKSTYENSSIQLSRNIAKYDKWDKDSLESRSKHLTTEVLKIWPWKYEESSKNIKNTPSAPLKWRLTNSEWQSENSASDMVLNVVAKLLDQNSSNAQKLSGEAVRGNVHPAKRYPPGSMVGSITMRAIPRYPDYVIYPYTRNYPMSEKLCRELGERCNVEIETLVRDGEESKAQKFWHLLREQNGGLPGQKDYWRGPGQRTSDLNQLGDCIGIYVGNLESLWLYIKGGNSSNEQVDRNRMIRYSHRIQENMNDQKLDGDIGNESKYYRSIAVVRQWVRDDEDEWPEICNWIMDQQQRLQAIITNYNNC